MPELGTHARVMLLAVASFLLAALTDFVLVRHQQSVRARKKHQAGFWSALACVVITALMLFDVESIWFLIPQAVGCYVGNVVALWRGAPAAPDRSRLLRRRGRVARSSTDTSA